MNLEANIIAGNNGFNEAGQPRVTFCRDTSDSISRILEEAQTCSSDTRYVTHSAFTSYPATGFTFPNNRVINPAFDALYRKNGITEVIDSLTTSIAAWQFFGGRIATVTLGNGIVTSFMNNDQTRSAIQQGQTTPAWGSLSSDRLGYDGSGRLVAKRHVSPGDTFSVLVGFTTAYDPSSNKLFERALHAESRGSLYANDSMDRLTQYQRGTLASGGASITTPITLPNTDSIRNYALDGLGNWSNTSSTLITDTGPVAELDVRTHNKLNQITAFNAPSDPTPILYDAETDPTAPPQPGNGNLANDGTLLYYWDALNRLVAVDPIDAPEEIAVYVYDALGRRIIRTVSNGGASGTIPNGTSRYLLDGQRIVEELGSATGSAVVQYVWGQYIDELIQLNALVDIGPQSPQLNGKYYLLSDLLYRSAALTNSSGAIVEAYDTDAYGNTLLFSGPGSDSTWFTNDDVTAPYSACRYVFTGREFDAETGNYFYRARLYQCVLGRFLARDRILYAEGPSFYQYARSEPLRVLDPGGLIGWDFDEQACTVTMTFRIRLYWTWRNWGTVLGTGDKLAQLGKALKTYAEAEFNSGKFKIYPSGKTIPAYGIGLCFWHPARACPCQGGWTPKLNLITDATAFRFDAEIAVIYQDHSVDYPGERSATDSVPLLGHDADIYENDFNPSSNAAGAQVPAVHEFGHLLGLQHPGHDGITLPAPLPKNQWNNIPDYAADWPALMGGGMELRWFYFQRWADKLAAEYGQCAPFTIR